MASFADKFTILKKQEEYYSDFTTNLDLNPITGFLSKVTNEESIKQAVKQLILTNRTERYYNSYIGSRVRSLLFEPMDQITTNAIKNEIIETLQNNEPRIEVLEVIVEPFETRNEYQIQVIFTVINTQIENVSLNFSLQRVR